MWEQDIKHTINIPSTMKICDVGVLISIIVKLSKLRPYSLRDILGIFKEFEYVVIWSPKTLLDLYTMGFAPLILGTMIKLAYNLRRCGGLRMMFFEIKFGLQHPMWLDF
jgi:hypothetical protein